MPPLSQQQAIIQSAAFMATSDCCWCCAPLCRCVGILSLDVAPTAAPAVITTHALRTLAGLAAVEGARKEMEQHRQLLGDIIK